MPYYLGLLADAYRQVRPVPDALPLTDALERVERTGERWFEAELHRMKAEVLMASLRRGMLPQRQASLHRALEVAHTQGAKLWELRASTSLAQLWSNQVDASRRAACSRPFRLVRRGPRHTRFGCSRGRQPHSTEWLLELNAVAGWY